MPIAKKDIPTMISIMLKHANLEQVYAIAYSLGTELNTNDSAAETFTRLANECRSMLLQQGRALPVVALVKAPAYEATTPAGVAMQRLNELEGEGQPIVELTARERDALTAPYPDAESDA
jgi:hypothetical protein